VTDGRGVTPGVVVVRVRAGAVRSSRTTPVGGYCVTYSV
jgi:hypothetical protein